MLSFRRTAIAAAGALALAAAIASQAMASGEGTNARLGVRNPGSGNLTVQTQIIASNNNWGTRQSNKGSGGGAIYGCRSAPGAESCVRAVNLMNGIAFSFQSNSGTSPVGSFQVGSSSSTVSTTVAPFTTNASGKVTNLNADMVDGQSASEIVSQAVSQSSIAAVAANGALGKTRGATASSRSTTGSYIVTFGSSIANCVYQATINSAGGAPGFVSTTEATATTVSVSTFNVGGTAADLPFQLTVNC
jgi:hypothetical protein